jgi:hypothetical protein
MGIAKQLKGKGSQEELRKQVEAKHYTDALCDRCIGTGKYKAKLATNEWGTPNKKNTFAGQKVCVQVAACQNIWFRIA